MDQCVIQWKITQEKSLWDLDLLEHDRSTKDLYKEILPKDKFLNLQKEELTLRQEIYNDVISNIEPASEYTYDLTLSKTIIIFKM